MLGLIPGGLVMLPDPTNLELGPPIIARVPGDATLGPPDPTGDAIELTIIPGLVETGGIPIIAPGLSNITGIGPPGTPCIDPGPEESVGVEAEDIGGEFPLCPDVNC